MNDFYRTRMGHTYYEATLPRIATALERIATALEKVAANAERPAPAKPDEGLSHDR